MINNYKCKICRRLGVKLFLKGDKCLSPKCLMIKKPYPPGQKKNQRRRSGSEYSKELAEKQKLKNWYNLQESQFRKYVKEALEKRGKIENTGGFLIKKIESRLDNVVFRMGFAISRSQARQFVSHGHFLINGRKNNISSCQIKKGDIVALRPDSAKKIIFKNILPLLKKYNPPSWIKLDAVKLEGKIIGEPTLEEASPPAEISAIFEFYSR